MSLEEMADFLYEFDKEDIHFCKEGACPNFSICGVINEELQNNYCITDRQNGNSHSEINWWLAQEEEAK